MARTRNRNDRMGALPPRYAFVPNPHAGTKFTKCPRCGTKTNLRKLSLVIHVERVGLVILGKACRLCLRCETLIADQGEIDKLLTTVANESKPDYVVLGTADRQTFRRGLVGAASVEDLKEHTSDFKSYWKRGNQAGRYPKTESGNGRAG